MTTRKRTTVDKSASDTKDLGAQALELARQRQGAANEVLALLERHFATSAPHPESVLFAAAWLAGTSLHRALALGRGPDQQKATVEARVSEEWPKLIRTFVYLVEKFGIQVKADQTNLELAAEHESHESLRQIQEELQTPYNAIMSAHGFDYADGAKTGAVACALLVRGYCLAHKVLEPALAVDIVATGLVEGAKTAPAPLG